MTISMLAPAKLSCDSSGGFPAWAAAVAAGALGAAADAAAGGPGGGGAPPGCAAWARAGPCGAPPASGELFFPPACAAAGASLPAGEPLAGDSSPDAGDGAP